jgi:hypothetical protein
VKGINSLPKSLDKLVAKDRLEDWNCEKYVLEILLGKYFGGLGVESGLDFE